MAGDRLSGTDRAGARSPGSGRGTLDRAPRPTRRPGRRAPPSRPRARSHAPADRQRERRGTIRIRSGAFGAGRPGSRSRITRIADAGSRSEAPGSGRGGTGTARERPVDVRAPAPPIGRSRRRTARFAHERGSAKTSARIHRWGVGTGSCRGSVPGDQGPRERKRSRPPRRRNETVSHGIGPRRSRASSDSARLAAWPKTAHVPRVRREPRAPVRSPPRGEVPGGAAREGRRQRRDREADRAGNATGTRCWRSSPSDWVRSASSRSRELALTERGSNWDWWRPPGTPTARDRRATADPVARAGPGLRGGGPGPVSGRSPTRRGPAARRRSPLEQQTTDEMTDLVDTSEAWRAAVLDPGLFAALVAQTPSSGVLRGADSRSRLDRCDSLRWNRRFRTLRTGSAAGTRGGRSKRTKKRRTSRMEKVVDELSRLIAFPTVSNRPVVELAAHLAQRRRTWDSGWSGSILAIVRASAPSSPRWASPRPRTAS